MSDSKDKLFNSLFNDKDDIFTGPTEPQDGINVLCEYLLGENFYIAAPICNRQANTVIVHEILCKYSRKYRRDLKKREKSR